MINIIRKTVGLFIDDGLLQLAGWIVSMAASCVLGMCVGSPRAHVGRRIVLMRSVASMRAASGFATRISDVPIVLSFSLERKRGIMPPRFNAQRAA